MKGHIRGWQLCPDCHGRGAQGAGICTRCAGAGRAPVWRHETESGTAVLEFARTLNPAGGALGDALPFSLTPPVSRARDARPISLFEGTVDDEDR